MKNWYRHTAPGKHLSNARMVIAGFVATAILFASCHGVDIDLPATEQGSILTQFNVSVSNAKLTYGKGKKTLVVNEVPEDFDMEQGALNNEKNEEVTA